MNLPIIGVTLQEIYDYTPGDKKQKVKPLLCLAHNIEFFEMVIGEPDADGKAKILHYRVNFASGKRKNITVESFASVVKLMESSKRNSNIIVPK